jgi:lysine-specific demethylase 3
MNVGLLNNLNIVTDRSLKCHMTNATSLLLQVHMLMHAAEMHNQCSKRLLSNGSERIANGTGAHVNDHSPVPDLDLDVGEQERKHTISHCEEVKANNLEESQAGAIWDVFCRQDLPKLNEYLAAHQEEFGATCQAVPSVITTFFCIKLV